MKKKLSIEKRNGVLHTKQACFSYPEYFTFTEKLENSIYISTPITYTDTSQFSLTIVSRREIVYRTGYGTRDTSNRVIFMIHLEN